MKITLLKEVIRMQKIAGILKEDDDLDLSDTPEFTQTLEQLQDNPTYTDFSDDSPWEHRMFALLDKGGSCYLIENLPSEGDDLPDDDEYTPELIRLKKGLTTKKVVAMGEKKKFWEVTQFGNFVDTSREDELNAWLDSLKA